MRQAPAALALLFLIAHLAWSPGSLGDIDEVNFALGVRHFDVAAHQPHPPGYPVFIAAANASTALLQVLGVPSHEVRGLSYLGALAGALAIPLLVSLFGSLTSDDRVALWSAMVVAAAPLFWFTASRPLSDVTGFTVALFAQALLVGILMRPHDSRSAGGAAVVAAFAAGLGIGVRSQSVLLTLPLLAAVLLTSSSALTGRQRVYGLAAWCAGVLLWAAPLVVLSGGVDSYVAALGDQAGEDFTGALMVWTSRSARVFVDALQYSFLWPWGGLAVGSIVVALAAAGAGRMLLRQRSGLLVLLLAYVPYALFHLVFQETVMTRYAIPLMTPVAVLAVYAIASLGPVAVHACGAAFMVVALMTTLPAWLVYARHTSPGAQIVADAFGGTQTALVGMHAVMSRHEQWYHDNASGRSVRARHGGEILAIVDRWRESPDAEVRFMADPRRTDLAMLDPRSVEWVRSYEWGFREMPFLSGSRPNRLQLVALRPPGWMLDHGWAVTAEVGGLSARAGARPEVRPSVAWVRSREEQALLAIGGRNLGSPGTPPARFVLRVGDRVHDEWSSEPGFFFRRVLLPAGTLRSAEAYIPLRISASAPREGPVASLEQFDLQTDGIPMVGFSTGWQEPEYNRITALAWRWMSARADLWVRPVGRDVTLSIRGESPLRYFDAAPALRLSIGDQPVSQLAPDADFTWTMVLPDRLLASHDGAVVIQSDKWFVPGGATGGDRRQLALRVFSVAVD